MNSDIQYVSLRGSVSVFFLLLISLETMRYMGGGECVWGGLLLCIRTRTR